MRQHKYTTLRTKVIVCAYTAVAAAHDRVAILAQGDALHQRQQYGRAHNALSADSESGGVSGHDNRNRERTAFESQLEDRLRRKGEGYVLTIHLSKFYHIHTILGTEKQQ